MLGNNVLGMEFYQVSKNLENMQQRYFLLNWLTPWQSRIKPSWHGYSLLWQTLIQC